MSNEEKMKEFNEYGENLKKQLLQKKVQVDIQVDNKEIARIVNENETLKADHAEFETAKAMLDDMKNKASAELSELGIPTQAEDLKSKEDLDRAVLTIKKLKGTQPKNYYSPSGSAPLQNQYSQGDSQTFGSEKEMVDNLMARVHQGDKEAKRILDAMTKKVFAGMIDAGKANQVVKPYDSTQDPETDLQRWKRIQQEKKPRRD